MVGDKAKGESDKKMKRMIETASLVFSLIMKKKKGKKEKKRKRTLNIHSSRLALGKMPEIFINWFHFHRL